MSKKQLIILIGVWVIFIPFLGLPDFWKKIILILTGLLLVWIGYDRRRERKNFI